MTDRKHRLGALPLLLLFSALSLPAPSRAGASEAEASVQIAPQYRIEHAGDGSMLLVATVTLPRPGYWLGLTLHPNAASGAALPSRDEIRPLKAGRARVRVPIDRVYQGGEFEAAIWSSRQGSRLAGMVHYFKDSFSFGGQTRHEQGQREQTRHAGHSDNRTTED